MIPNTAKFAGPPSMYQGRVPLPFPLNPSLLHQLLSPSGTRWGHLPVCLSSTVFWRCWVIHKWNWMQVRGCYDLCVCIVWDDLISRSYLRVISWSSSKHTAREVLIVLPTTNHTPINQLSNSVWPHYAVSVPFSLCPPLVCCVPFVYSSHSLHKSHPLLTLTTGMYCWRVWGVELEGLYCCACPQVFNDVCSYELICCWQWGRLGEITELAALSVENWYDDWVH